MIATMLRSMEVNVSNAVAKTSWSGLLLHFPYTGLLPVLSACCERWQNRHAVGSRSRVFVRTTGAKENRSVGNEHRNYLAF